MKELLVQGGNRCCDDPRPKLPPDVSTRTGTSLRKRVSDMTTVVLSSRRVVECRMIAFLGRVVTEG